MANQHLRSETEEVNPPLPSEYDTIPEEIRVLKPKQRDNRKESGPGDDQKEPDLGSGLEPSKRKIWGMKRKTFMIALGIIILLIIAVAVGAGAGAAVAGAKNKNIVSESAQSGPQSSSSYAPQIA